MVAWTEGRLKPNDEVINKHKANAFLLRYKKDGKVVELSGPALAPLSKQAEELSMKHGDVWVAELCDTGEDSLAGYVHCFKEGKEASQHHNFWNPLTANVSAPAKKGKAEKPKPETKGKKAEAPKPETKEEVKKVQTVATVDTQGKETKMTKPAKKAATKAEKTAPKKVAAKKVDKKAPAQADKVAAKRPAKISGKLEKIDAPADKAVGKREAEALFTALAIRENTVRWNAARYLADNMGVAVPADTLIKKTYGKEGGTTSSIGRVIDGIHANAEKNKVKVVISGFKRDGVYCYRMEKA